MGLTHPANACRDIDLSKVGKLLDRAEEAASRVVIDVDFKHQDRAYVQYLICSDILLHVIPKHKDFSAVSNDRGDWQRRYRTLCKVSNMCFFSRLAGL